MASLLSCGCCCCVFSDVVLLFRRLRADETSWAVSFLAQKYMPNRPHSRAIVRASLVSEPRLLRRAPSAPASCAIPRVRGLWAAAEGAEATMTAEVFEVRGRVSARVTRSRRRRDWDSVVERAPVRRLV